MFPNVIPAKGTLDEFALEQASYQFIAKDGNELTGTINGDLSYDLSVYTQEEVYLRVTKGNFAYLTNRTTVAEGEPEENPTLVDTTPPSEAEAIIDPYKETISFDGERYEASYLKEFTSEIIKSGNIVKAGATIYLRKKADINTQACEPVIIMVPTRLDTPAVLIIKSAGTDEIEIDAVAGVIYVLNEAEKMGTVVFDGLEANTRYAVVAYVPSDGKQFKSLTSSNTVQTKAIEEEPGVTEKNADNEKQLKNGVARTSLTGDTAPWLFMGIAFVISGAILVYVIIKKGK